jgi:hypothetical protein
MSRAVISSPAGATWRTRTPRAPELLVDWLAHGMTGSNGASTLLCGGRSVSGPRCGPMQGGTAARSSRRRHWRSGVTRATVIWWSRWRNGMPFLAPLWTKRPVVCLVNHAHRVVAAAIPSADRLRIGRH